jgi:hypothetical protein
MIRETLAVDVGRVTGEMPVGIGGLMRRKQTAWMGGKCSDGA